MKEAEQQFIRQERRVFGDPIILGYKREVTSISKAILGCFSSKYLAIMQLPDKPT